jgi:hypothetical protein
MAPKPQVLVWPGSESMSEIEQALSEDTPVELVLSAGLHNALFTRFGTDAPPESAGQVDVEGGAELLGRLDGIAGLEPLVELADTLRQRAWRVAIISPTPRIMLSPPR